VTHIICGLIAKNRDQLRNPTLGIRVWATFTFFILHNGFGDNPKTALSPGGSGTPPNTCTVPWPTQVHIRNGIWIGSAVLAQLTNRHTHTHRPCYICSNTPYLSKNGKTNNLPETKAMDVPVPTKSNRYRR